MITNVCLLLVNVARSTCIAGYILIYLLVCINCT